MPESDVSDLKSHIGFWMRFVSNHVSHSFARRIGHEGVTVAEWVILREMYASDGKLSPGELVLRTGLTKGAISKLIERLYAKKLATRATAFRDKRFQEIGLTAAGRAVVPRLARLADQNDREFFEGLSPQEQATLIKTLKKIVQHRKLVRIPIS